MAERKCSACRAVDHNRLRCGSLQAAAWDIEDAITSLEAERVEECRGRDWRIANLKRALARVERKRAAVARVGRMTTPRRDEFATGWNAAVDHMMKILGVRRG
jgi:hypothetical protein